MEKFFKNGGEERSEGDDKDQVPGKEEINN